MYQSADEDAVITLTHVGSKTPVASIYVQSDSTQDLKGVPGSTFEAYIAYGSDWDSSAHAFTRNCAARTCRSDRRAADGSEAEPWDRIGLV